VILKTSSYSARWCVGSLQSDELPIRQQRHGNNNSYTVMEYQSKFNKLHSMELYVSLFTTKGNEKIFILWPKQLLRQSCLENLHLMLPISIVKFALKKILIHFKKISQISCYDANLAPDSCTQYLYGTTGTLNTYNWDGGNELANQKQTICIR
jgi:hypothetical protein